MNQWFLSALCIAFVGCGVSNQVTLPSPQSEIRQPEYRGLWAGFGKADITPAPGMALNGNGPHTPIVAMTANAMIGDKENCIKVGMDDYMSKPIIYSNLIEVLARWA